MVSERKLFGQVQIELEYRRIIMNTFSLALVLLFSGFFFMDIAFSQETPILDVTVVNTNGDRVDHFEMLILVYEQGNDVPILEINPSNNPFEIDSLQIGKQYQIDVFVNSMYGESIFVNLDDPQTSVKAAIPISAGFRITTLYDDAYTPIDGASVTISSHDGKVWRSGITSKDGKTMRFWMQPTTMSSEFYNVEVSLGNNLVFQGPKIRLTPASQPEIRIVTDWPTIVDKLITINVYKNQTTKISPNDGNFVVELVDSENNVVDSSSVSHRGESFFSNMKVGDYTLRLIRQSEGLESSEEWASKEITISGQEDKFVLESTFGDQQNDDLPEEKVENTENCNCVAFRLDDIQDYWLSESQVHLLNFFHDKKIPLTIGIVGGKIGEDETIVNSIQEKLVSGSPPLELANHSWSDERLTQMTQSEQSEAIENSNEKIFEIFGKRPTTLIPPGNLFNEETIELLLENSFTHISASLITDPPPYSLTDLPLYHFPQTASTGSYNIGESHFVGVSYDETFEEINSSIKEYGFAVVMMHPQEFSVWRDGELHNEINKQQIQELEKLIDKIIQEEIDIVLLGKLNLDAKERNQFVFSYKTCNCVSFRLDTVQDWWLADVNTAIIEQFKQHNAGLTIGTIGNFIGDDPNLVEFLKDTIEQNNFIEIANNGWNYEDFTTLSYDEQKSLLKKSNDSIQKTLGIEPKVFIPPHNRYDDSTISALKDSSFSHISSSQALSEPPYSLENEFFYYFPLTASTGIYDSENAKFAGLPYTTTFEDVINSLETHGFAVVNLTPQEFSINEDGQHVDNVNSQQFDELKKLLGEIKKTNFEIVPISQINLDSADDLEIPNWIKNNAGWWSEDQITDSDFTSGIEYMIKEKIIRIPELPETEYTAEQMVPNWIKNNAGWWAQNLITDEDFVNGIEYLVKNGIILV